MFLCLNNNTHRESTKWVGVGLLIHDFNPSGLCPPPLSLRAEEEKYTTFTEHVPYVLMS